MKNLIEQIRFATERHGFEVCSRLADRMGIPAYRVRLFFVYSTFITLFSPLILYMALAFILKLKDYIYERKTSVWDL
jgi:phage shock protein PspC (stress-responsive transcriptional regulator)